MYMVKRITKLWKIPAHEEMKMQSNQVIISSVTWSLPLTRNRSKVIGLKKIT